MKVFIILRSLNQVKTIRKYYDESNDVLNPPLPTYAGISYELNENRLVKSSNLETLISDPGCILDHESIKSYDFWHAHFYQNVPVSWERDVRIPELPPLNNDQQIEQLRRLEQEGAISEVEYEDTRPVKFSFIIDRPSPDIDPAGKEVIHITAATRSIDDFSDIIPVPAHVIEFLKNVEAAGHYRAEILVGDTVYKMYIKP